MTSTDNTELLMLDVGAAGGITELPTLAPWLKGHAFEPRAAAARAVPQGLYRCGVVHPIALGTTDGTAVLYVTREPCGSSLRQPDQAVAHWRGVAEKAAHGLEVLAKEAVPTIRLTTFLDREGIDCVDYIKLDTQGTELDILLASESALARLSVIRMEVEFVPYYQGQALFWDIAVALTERGFRFLDLPFEARKEDTRGRLLWGEALFYNLTPRDAARQARVLDALGYWREAGTPPPRSGGWRATARRTLGLLIPSYLQWRDSRRGIR